MASTIHAASLPASRHVGSDHEHQQPTVCALRLPRRCAPGLPGAARPVRRARTPVSGPGELGLWLAGSRRRASRCCHELGHAFAARATGAKAEHRPRLPRRLRRRSSRPGRSSAGSGPASPSPARPCRSCSGIGVLAAMGVNPLDRDRVATSSASQLAIWWAGPVIGLINLAPDPAARRRQHRHDRASTCSSPGARAS